MNTLADFTYTDNEDDVLAVYVNRLLASTLRSEYKNVMVLSGDVELEDGDSPIQNLDCNGADRIVKLPVGDDVENHPYFIINSTASGDWTLTVQSNDEAVDHAVLEPGQFLLCLPDGVGEYKAIGAPVEVEVEGGGGDGWTAYSAVIPTRIASGLDGTFTVTIASPAVFTKTAHGLGLGQKIRLTTTGSLPTGLAINTDYFVIPTFSVDTFNLATSLANALAGTAINTSGSQSGTHSIVVDEDPVYRLQFAGVDLTGILQEGMPIKWTQNAIVRYGWIATAPAFSTNTTFYVQTRTDSASADYDILDTGTYPISDFAYGLPKQPGAGFPAHREMWDVVIDVTTAYQKTSPTVNQWYKEMNSGKLPHIIIPRGRWNLAWSFLLYGEITSGTRAACTGTLSTSIANPPIETDKRLTNTVSLAQAGTANVYIYSAASRNKDLVVTAPATYYFMLLTFFSSQTYIGVDNSVTNTIKIKNNYL